MAVNIIQLTERAEKEQLEEFVSDKKNYKYEEVISNLNSFFINDLGYLTGAIVNQGEGDYVELTMRDDGLSDNMKEVISDRLYRQFGGIYDMPYEETPEHLHINWNNETNTDNALVYRIKMEKVDNPIVVQMNKITVIEKSKKRIIAGYASVVEVDDENQVITKEALKDALPRFMKSKEYRNIMLEHEAIPVGKVIDNYGEYKTHVDDKGLYIVVEVRQDLMIAEEMWKRILAGDVKGFSIHGEVLNSHKDKGILFVDKLNFYEITICKTPVNTSSGFEVI